MVASHPLLAVLLGFAVAAALVSAWRHVVPAGRGYRFVAKPLLTANEREFYGRLRQALPDFSVLPQVAMSALLRSRGQGRDADALAGFRRFSQKVVDFVVCDDELKVVALVELDDRTHSAQKDRLRDAMTEEAGYRTLRYSSRQKPTAAAIRKDVLRLAKG